MRSGFDPSRRRWLRVGLAGALPAGSAHATGSGASLADALQAVQADPRAPLAGLSVLVMRAGQVVFEGKWGQRFIDPADERRSLPVTADTLFRMASVSKLFVALGVMRLVEAGRLDLDADAGRWLGHPLRNPHFPGVPITPRLLLSHRSSLRDEGGYVVEPGQALQDLLLPGGALHGTGRCWAEPSADVDMRPGAYFSYCNLNYGVLGSVIERASGQRFDRFMHEQVLAPLGMSGGFDPSTFSDAQVAQVATLYRKAPDENGPWDPRGPWLPQADDWRGRRPGPLPGLDGYALGRNGTLFGPQGRLLRPRARPRLRDAHAGRRRHDRGAGASCPRPACRPC
ncbi:MAG: serine hydrolase domain-containing protein [Burkholderiaceae bacterium]